MAYISDETLKHLLMVIGYLKAAENELEQAAENDEALLMTVDTDGLVGFKNEITDYIACNMRVMNDALSVIGVESILDFKDKVAGQINKMLAGKKVTISFE